MIVSRRMAVIPKDIHEVWKIVTSVEDAGWRSDLSRTEILNERQFVEYTKKGYPTILLLRLRRRTDSGNLIWKIIRCRDIGEAFSSQRGRKQSWILRNKYIAKSLFSGRLLSFTLKASNHDMFPI